MTLQVIVPSYNCAEWIGRCLDSIASQTYTDYQVVVIDDASTDPNQMGIIAGICDARQWIPMLNTENMGAGWNIYHAIHEQLQCEFDDPIVIVDGDDFLPHENVFARIADIYADPDVWMMWSQYAPYPYHTTLDQNWLPVRVDPATTRRTQIQSVGYTQEEATTPGFYRDHPLRCNHIITFRSFVFMEGVTVEDLTLEDGTWPKAGYDRMIFTPCLEMCGADHIKFVDEVLYYYNSMNPISDVTVRRPDGDAAHARVQRIPFKQPILNAWVKEQRAGL